MSSGVSLEYIDNYIKSLTGESSGILKELEDYAKENSVPIVQKEIGNFLDLLINIKKPKKILELGTAIGYSSILMSLSSDRKSVV